MKIRFKISLLVITLCLLKLSLVDAQVPKSSFIVNEREIDIDSIETQIRFLMDDIGIPGLSFAVIDQNKEVYYNSFGYKYIEDGEKQTVDNETVFEACSLSKSFLVYAAHSMAAQGLLDLDKPLHEYMKLQALEHDERYKLITARMVLSHSSGLENHIYKNNKNLLEILANPGERYIYSGEGYEYLGMVMAKIVDQPIEKFMKNMVYNPLHLDRTFTTIEETEENLAFGHNVFGEVLQTNRTIIQLKAKIITNARDYAKLMIELFSNKNISGKGMGNLLDPIVRSEDNAEFFYGPGFEVLYTPKDTILFQGGNNSGYKGLACYSVTKKCGFVFFANHDRADQIPLMLNKLATRIAINPYFDYLFTNQYPSNANELFRVYREEGLESMRKRLNYFLINEDDSFTDNDIVELVYYFKDREFETAKYLTDKYLERHPDSTVNFLYEKWLKKKE